MYQIVYQMYRVASDWAWHGVLESYTNLLKSLLTLDDGLHVVRMDEMVNGPHGLLTVLTQRTQTTGRMSGHYQDQQLTRKYTEICQDLYKLQVFKDWVEMQDEAADQDFAWFRRLIDPSQRESPFGSYT